ncbi:MAG: cytochrome c [Trueperaceae bacterium]
MPADDPTRQTVVSAAQVRLGYALGGIGAVSLIVAVLILATARPQGAYVTLDATQHEAALDRADVELRGFDVRDDGSARVDIEHAMRLVAERGTSAVDGASAASASTTEPEAAAATADAATSDETTTDETMAEATTAAPQPDGAALYAQHCIACHQANGQGLPGAFPPVANHVGNLVAADRTYPVQLLLYGMVGPITVDGAAYNGLMPAFAASMDDAEIAAVLEHVLDAWGDRALAGDDHEPYTAEDVATERARSLTSAEVHERRVALTLP